MKYKYFVSFVLNYDNESMLGDTILSYDYEIDEEGFFMLKLDLERKFKAKEVIILNVIKFPL